MKCFVVMGLALAVTGCAERPAVSPEMMQAWMRGTTTVDSAEVTQAPREAPGLMSACQRLRALEGCREQVFAGVDLQSRSAPPLRALVVEFRVREERVVDRHVDRRGIAVWLDQPTDVDLVAKKLQPFPSFWTNAAGDAMTGIYVYLPPGTHDATAGQVKKAFASPGPRFAGVDF